MSYDCSDFVGEIFGVLNDAGLLPQGAEELPLEQQAPAMLDAVRKLAEAKDRGEVMNENRTPIADAIRARYEDAKNEAAALRVGGDAIDRLEEVERERAALASALRGMVARYSHGSGNAEAEAELLRMGNEGAIARALLRKLGEAKP